MVTRVQKTTTTTIQATDEQIDQAEAIYVQESWVFVGSDREDEDGNITRDSYIMGESEIYETWASFADMPRLYKRWLAEYGKCTGKMYIDGTDGKPIHVGYIFLQRIPYEDARSKGETFLRETWISYYHKTETGVYESVKLS